MRKLTLESLRVESFTATPPAPGPRGTVQGHAAAVTGLPCPSFNPCLPSWDPDDCARI